MGDGREEGFWEALRLAANDPSRQNLSIRILMDASRATRPIRNELNGEMTSTASKLSLSLGSSRAYAALFHSPLLRGLMKRTLPPRLREILGVQHMKAFVFDDDVIITGANISNTYFLNRQDRAIVVHRAARLADFNAAVIDTVSRFSYPLKIKPRSRLQSKGADHRFGKGGNDIVLGDVPAGVDPVKNPWKFCQKLKEELGNIALPGFHIKAGCNQQESSSLQRSFGVSGLDRLDRRHYQFVKSHSTVKCTDWNGSDTWIFPLVQAGFAGFYQEGAATLLLLRHAASHNGSLVLTSPYLNLSTSYEYVLAHSNPLLTLRLLTASPEANGFFGAPGISGAIPLAYSLLEYRTWRKLTADQATFSRQLLEYSRKGWEYHAKGIYWSPGQAGGHGPAVTSIGSSNFGYRSLYRDLECQFILATKDQRLRDALRAEQAALLSHCQQVDLSHLSSPGRKGSTAHRLLVRLLRSLL